MECAEKYCKGGKEFFVRTMKENKKLKGNRNGKGIRKRKWIMKKNGFNA
jgi:hypothetical protein